MDSHANRGFWAAELGLDAVLRRLEVRLILEPGLARLAAERRTDDDLAVLRARSTASWPPPTSPPSTTPRASSTSCSRAATGNREHVLILEGLWLIEVGRRLLAARTVEDGWQHTDADEHAEILAAVRDRDADRAEALTRAHVRDALRHWQGAPS